MRGRFENIINTDKPVLVDFYAEWCAPCKVVPPLLKQVKERFNDNIRIIKVNVDSNPSIAGRYDIRSIPTLMLFRNGRTLWKAAGVELLRKSRGWWSRQSAKVKVVIYANHFCKISVARRLRCPRKDEV